MDVAALITDLQSRGLRVESPVERRSGGAGPSDSGLLWIDGVAVTVPTGPAWGAAAPRVLREEEAGFGIYRDSEPLAGASAGRRPRYYDLETADGVPYWKIALLHLD